METKATFGTHLNSKHEDVHLNELVSRVIADFEQVAVRQNLLIINEISPSVVVTTDANLLAAIINNLFAAVIGKNNKSCITVTAKPFSNLFLLHIKIQNNNIQGTTIEDYDEFQPLAAEIGGCITISKKNNNTETLTLSFFDYASLY